MLIVWPFPPPSTMGANMELETLKIKTGLIILVGAWILKQCFIHVLDCFDSNLLPISKRGSCRIKINSIQNFEEIS